MSAKSDYIDCNHHKNAKRFITLPYKYFPICASINSLRVMMFTQDNFAYYNIILTLFFVNYSN